MGNQVDYSVNLVYYQCMPSKRLPKRPTRLLGKERGRRRESADGGEVLQRIRVDRPNDEQPLARHLILLFRAFEDELLTGLHAHAEFRSITAADHDVLRYIRPEGSTAVEIARLNGTTKQAVSKAIASLERRGFVVRTPDPVDRRAVRITFSDKGFGLVTEAVRIIGAIEARQAKRVGAREYRKLKQMLQSLFEAYAPEDEENHADPDPRRRNARVRG